MIVISIHDLCTSGHFEFEGKKYSMKALMGANRQQVFMYFQTGEVGGMTKWEKVGEVFPATRKQFAVRKEEHGITWECRIPYGKCNGIGYKPSSE